VHRQVKSRVTCPSKRQTRMYTISQYGNMYMNKARINAYAGALRDAVTANSVVLDMGAGTGIFALLACRYGARRVYAIEPDDAINLARELATANGYSDRLTCIQSLSTKVNLPERVNVIISDLSGKLPLFGRHIAAIMDARDRFLAPGGTLIVQQDHLRAAVIEAPNSYRMLTQPWSENLFGLDLRAGWSLVANTQSSLTDKQVKLLTRPSKLAVLDYRTIADSNMGGELAWTMEQPGTGHGVAVWFDRIFANGIKISNEPGAPKAVNTSDIHGQAFFPWPNPVDLEAGDQVSLHMKADLVNDQYIWQWETTIHASGREEGTKIFRQSSLHGHPLSLESLKKQETEYIAEPNEDTQLDVFILSKIDGKTSLRQIAHALAANFPLQFNGWQEALSRVRDVSVKYGGR
jgi:type I protein arginine methyltransferase